MTTPNPANTALRELLIAAADWNGTGEFSTEDKGDSLQRYEDALNALSLAEVLPDPGAVLRSLGWGLVDWAPPVSAPGSSIAGIIADVQNPGLSLAEIATNSAEIIGRHMQAQARGEG